MPSVKARYSMLRKSPLRAKRLTPRRTAPDRVTHVRQKPKAKAAPTVSERAHMARVAALGCLISGEPATLHHVTASIDGGRIVRSHQRIVPLAPRYHQAVFDPKSSDPISVEQLGHRGFYLKHGFDLLTIADALWKESCEATS